MSAVKVTRKRAAAPRKDPLSELLTPMMPFVAVPLGFMREVAEGVDHLFGVSPGAQAGRWTPAVDFEQCDGKLVVTAELPGLKKEEVHVALTDKSLIITGKHTREHKTDHDGLHRIERRYGQFYRSIPLPEGARTDHVKAELHDGVLKVSMPVAETKGRQIPVQNPAAA